MTMRIALMVSLMTVAGSTVWAVPSIVESPADGVYVVRDDNGEWGGASTGITHQNASRYQARKTLDLTDLPAEVWEQTREVRLSVYLVLHDYSWHGPDEVNGLDEVFELVVNGTVHSYRTDCGVPVFARGTAMKLGWYNFIIPKDELVRGANEILVRKGPGDKNDDYMYLGIDNSARRGNSAVTFDETNWTQEKLTIPGGNGEYMVRLYLVTRDTTAQAKWRPGATPPLDDPAGLVLYAGARDAQVNADGLALTAGQSARVEWHPQAFDHLRPVEVVTEADGPVSFAWLDEAGEAMEPVEGLTQMLPANRAKRTSGLQITAVEAATLRSVTLTGHEDFLPRPMPIDMAPVIAPSRPPAPGPPSCKIADGKAVLRNGGLRAVFETDGRLRLVSLANEFTKTEMVRAPDHVLLFLVGVGEERYAGSRDFTCKSVTATANGFVANLALAKPALAAELTITIDEEGLRLSLTLSNAGDAPVDFKLAFPHMAGLAVSDDPADDYYFFPMGGGIIADKPAIIRKGYGDHEALYQVMDIFSPAKGGGLYVRADDAEGWHKVLALRKYIPSMAGVKVDRLSMKVRDEYKWTNPLEAVLGTGFAYEYLRRTRKPGESFAPADAVIAGHPGDWHVAMQRYADWAHEAWQFRPYPSKLRTCHNMLAAGWGTGYLFRDGAYRTDIIKPRKDCVELMSWWDWSEVGPFGTPMDQLDTIMTPAQIKRWKGYFVDDPVTGRKMWNNAPNDYRGYNKRFGGLPAFRQAIKTYRSLDTNLVTLYTDPFRLHDACETGQAHGEEWGVVGTNGEKTRNYMVWNPCHDLAAVREWVAEEMGRVMRETGADGIRLDEYGHRGWACYDETHDHTYAEPGITQWQKATSEATRMVHEAMDKVRPDLVLTTEHPGYDYLMQYLEGCITYDLTGQASPLRPLECNAQRFYFPECKAYELDHRSADLKDRKKFWNAVESFGRYYPLDFYTILAENEDVYQSRDAYPLLVTPGNAPRVYVNRFRGAGKTIYHFYNATGHTFEGTALAVVLADGEHLFDMLACREVVPEMRDGLAFVSVYLARDDVACVAKLQRRMSVAREGDALTVTVSGEADGCRLVVAGASSKTLLEQAATSGVNTLDLARIEDGKTPACVKLLRGRDLVDVAATQAKHAQPRRGRNAKLTLPALRKQRKAATHRKRRIIFNNDGDDACYYNKKGTPEGLLEVRTTPLQGSQVDTVFYSTSACFPAFTHNTKVGEVFTCQEKNYRHNSVPALIAQGTDPLHIMVKHCKENAIEIFWSLRVNDTHDSSSAWYGPVLFTQFKKDHPECIVGSKTKRPKHGTWSSVDYAQPVVRNLCFRIIEEVCQNYDVDGIEFDFFRHACFFKTVADGQPARQEELDMMTGLLRRVREMTEREGMRRGRPILVSIRVPDSVEYAKGIGLDLERWLADGLVDMLVTTGYFRLNPWRYSVKLGHKYGVPVYPCLSDSRVRGETGKLKRRSLESYRGRAAQAWQAGADGIYLFNLFNPRLPHWRELGNKITLRGRDKLYFATYRDGNAGRYLTDGNGFCRAPVIVPRKPRVITSGAPQNIEIVVAEEVSAALPKVACHLRLGKPDHAPRLVAKLNGVRLDNPTQAKEWVSYPVDSKLLRQGANHIGISVKRGVSGEEKSASASETWDVAWQGKDLAKYPQRVPWRCLIECSDYAEQETDGRLLLADRSSGETDMMNLVYPWHVDPKTETVAELRAKVSKSTGPLAVCIRVANGVSVEYVTLGEKSIDLRHAGISCPFDTTSDFHTYTIVLKGRDIRIHVDGELKLDGTGKFTVSALDKSHWLPFLYGSEHWNKCSLLFGSASGPGHGEATWEFVRFRSATKSLSLLDLVVSVRYPEKAK